MLKQHYYTAFNDPERQSEGFGTKAQSAGLTDDTIKNLEPNLLFIKPRVENDAASQSEQIAYRYRHLGGDTYALIQSVHSDEGGRPGNFFAHSLIGSEEDFGSVAPISLYAHPTWVRNHPSMERNLSETDIAGATPTIAENDVLQFVSNPQYRSWLTDLISALVHINTGGNGSKIIIVGDSDTAAIWIAAISYCLPPALRTRLTFSTYEQDMTSSRGHITGYLSQGRYPTESDFADFFILDPANGKISSTHPSKYASFVVGKLTNGRYDELQGFLEFADRRMGRSQGLDVEWDGVVDTFQALLSIPDNNVSPGHLELFRGFIRDIQEQPRVDAADLAFLNQVAQVFRKILIGSKDSQALTDYVGVARILARNDTSSLGNLQDDLRLLASSLDSPGFVNQFIPLMLDVYGSEAVTSAFSQDTYLRLLDSNISSIPTAQAAWSTIEKLLGANRLPPSILQTTLKQLEAKTAESNLPQGDSQQLLGSLATYLKGREVSLFKSLPSPTTVPEEAVRHWLYYEMVKDQPLKERLPIRTAAALTGPRNLMLEFRRDLKVERPNDAVSVLDNWLSSVQIPGEISQQFTESAVKRLLSTQDPAQRTQASKGLLNQGRYIQALEDETLSNVIESAFSDIDPTAQFDERAVALIEKYARHSATPPETARKLKVALDINSGELGAETLNYWRSTTSQLSTTNYRDSLLPVMRGVISLGATLEEYKVNVRTGYAPDHAGDFWDIHDSLLVQLLGSEPPKKGIMSRFQGDRVDGREIEQKARWCHALLSYWYQEAPSDFLPDDFAIQGFFAHLPFVITRIREGSEGKHFFSMLESLSEGSNWRTSFIDILNQVSAAEDR